MGTQTSARAASHQRTPTGEVVVALHDIHRRFGDTPALAGLTFTVPERSITVLLGPNGAGKTTTSRIITGALGPDRGSVSVFGLDPAADGTDVRQRCGVVSAKPALYDRLTGRDNLRYAAELYGLGRGDLAERRIDEASDRFGITAALGNQVGGYSTGMKTRLALARSVLHEPDLLLYDEPTSGLDPESSNAVLRLIREMTGDGRTVVMCTHLLLEAEGLADQVVVLQDGRSVVAGAPDELVSRYWPTTVVRIEADDPTSLDWLAGHDGVTAYQRSGEVAEVQVRDADVVPELVFVLAREQVRVRRIDPHRPTLEDLYFAVRRENGENRIGEVG